MKNPMIEANINEALFEAIDENEINGGVSSFDKFRYTNFGRQCGVTAFPSLVCKVPTVMTIQINCYAVK